VELVTCKTITITVKHHGHSVYVKPEMSTPQLVSGPVKFTIGERLDTLVRGGALCAAGSARMVGAGRLRLALTALRPRGAARYTLTARSVRATAGWFAGARS
jgi:hypothetical protein